MRAKALVGGVAIACAAAIVQCVGDSGPTNKDAGDDVDLTGTESHPCFGNGTCDDGLTCISKVCVRLDSGSSDGSVDGAKDSAAADVVYDISPEAFTFGCTTPTPCKLNAMICCFSFDQLGSFPGCTTVAAQTYCGDPAKCPSSYSDASCTTDVLHVCGTPADCTDGLYTKCCDNPFTMKGPQNVCVTQAMATDLSLSCL